MLNDNAQRPGWVDEDHDCDLPDVAVTLDGLTFDPRQDHWHLTLLGVSEHFEYATLRDAGAPPLLLNGFKSTVMVRLGAHSLTSCQSFHYSLLCCLEYIIAAYPDMKTISMMHLVSYRASLPNQKKYVSSVAHGYLSYWRNLGFHGISDEAAAYCADVREGAAQTGVAVRTRCPIDGPYTALEFSGICNAIHLSFGNGNITLYNYTLSLLSLTLGTRPGQLALLKIKDLEIVDDDVGQKFYLHIPRIKQRGVALRSLSRRRELIPEIGEVVKRHVDATIASQDSQTEFNNFPMFPVLPKGASHMRGDQHTSSTNIGTRIANTIESLGVISERTGKPINAHATRARRTVATRMAQEGHPALAIGDVLDHEDGQSAKIYVATRAEMIGRINEALAMHLAPLAQRFAGKIVDRNTQTEALKPILGVMDDGDCPQNIGGCGKYSFCFLAKPVACYTCVNFRPWVDASHGVLLQQLVSQRDRQFEFSGRVAEALDDTILAVAAVVKLCDEALRRDSDGVLHD